MSISTESLNYEKNMAMCEHNFTVTNTSVHRLTKVRLTTDSKVACHKLSKNAILTPRNLPLCEML